MIEATNLPKNTELEKNILGSLLIDKNALPLVIGLLNEDVFYDLKHKKIFSTIKSMFDKHIAIDITTIAQKLQGDKAMDEVGGAYYLSKLTDNIVHTNHLNTHIEMVVELCKNSLDF